MSVLWCVHVIGPDDLHAHPTFEAAEAHAVALNESIRAAEHRSPAIADITCRAVVAVWQWSAEAHASSLARHGNATIVAPVATPAEVEALRRERDAWEKTARGGAAEIAAQITNAATLRAANARLREAAELAAPLLLAAAFLTHAVNEKAAQCYEDASTKVRSALKAPTP
jgi:hypothetical protein